MNIKIQRIEYKTVKIAFNGIEEFVRKVNALHAVEIVSINPTTPDSTDNKTWVSVYYAH